MDAAFGMADEAPGEWDFDLLDGDAWVDDLNPFDTPPPPPPLGHHTFFEPPPPPSSSPPPYPPLADHFRLPRPSVNPLFGTRDFRQGTNWPPPAPAVQRPPRPIPPPSHSEDWLDQRLARAHRNTDPAQYRHPATLFEAHFAPPSESGSSEDTSWEISSPSYDEDGDGDGDGGHDTANHDPSSPYLTLENDSDPPEPSDNTMAPSTRNQARASVVDLTHDSNSPQLYARQPRGIKRAAEASSSSERGIKRSRPTFDDLEEIDLVDEAPSVDDELLKAQQEQAIRAQQQSEEGPQRLGKRQCCICLENYTNATATICGHLYCHECLVQALISSEKTNERHAGRCPVCRKNLSRSIKKRSDIIPISFMKKKTFEEHYRK